MKIKKKSHLAFGCGYGTLCGRYGIENKVESTLSEIPAQSHLASSSTYNVTITKSRMSYAERKTEQDTFTLVSLYYRPVVEVWRRVKDVCGCVCGVCGCVSGCLRGVWVCLGVFRCV